MNDNTFKKVKPTPKNIVKIKKQKFEFHACDLCVTKVPVVILFNIFMDENERDTPGTG